MSTSESTVRVALLTIAILLAIIVTWPYLGPPRSVAADVGRFDYVSIVSPVYLYQGRQGVLLLDKRNGNVWFVGRGDETNISFRDPVFVVRLPLEKLDQHTP